MNNKDIQLILSKVDGLKQLMIVHVTDIRNEMKSYAERVDKDFEDIVKCLEKQNGRIGKNEKWRWTLVGTMAGLGAITTVVAYFQFFIK